MSESKELHLADVIRHGDKLVLPEAMTPRQGIGVLERLEKYDEEIIRFSRTFDVFPWEGALALSHVLKDIFGYVDTRASRGMFGEDPPSVIQVEIGPDKYEEVLWGDFVIPGEPSERFSTSANMEDGMLKFVLHARIHRKYQPIVDRICKAITDHLASHSIYRAKAIRLGFMETMFSPDTQIAPPKFMRLSGGPAPIFNRDLERAVDVNVLTPIRHSDAVRKARIPLKRGVLLAGTYGTGKTLLAHHVARTATENGWTFCYLGEVGWLEDAIKFAQHYAPAVLFAEDIDRAMSGDRSTSMDEILNTIDGIESKGSELMVVLTTNHLERIHPAMLRPGRLDVVLNVLPPDAEAVERLIQLYGAGILAQGEDFRDVSEELAGNIPAVIREVVERAKLGFISRTGSATDIAITAQDLSTATYTLSQQQALIAANSPKGAEDPLAIFGRHVGEGLRHQLRSVKDVAKEQHLLNSHK